MGFAVTEPREKPRLTKPTSPRKTASGDFFAKPNRTRPTNRRQPLKTQLRKPTYAYEIASGRPFWPSRDPIEENSKTGEYNLYSFAKNDGVNRWDVLGRETSWTEIDLTFKPWGIMTRYSCTCVSTMHVSYRSLISTLCCPALAVVGFGSDQGAPVPHFVKIQVRRGAERQAERDAAAKFMNKKMPERCKKSRVRIKLNTVCVCIITD